MSRKFSVRRLFLPLFAAVVGVASFTYLSIAHLSNPKLSRDLERARQLAQDPDNPSGTEEAEALFKECLAEAQKSTNKADLFVTNAEYAPFLQSQNRWSEALPYYQAAAQFSAQTNHPMNESFHLEKIGECQHLLFRVTGEPPDLKTMTRALSLIEKERGPFSDVGKAQINATLACVYSDLGEYDKADETFKKAIELMGVMKSDPSAYIDSKVAVMRSQCCSLVARRKYVEANKLFIEARQLCDELPEPQKIQTLAELDNGFLESFGINAQIDLGVWGKQSLRRLFDEGKFDELDKRMDAIRKAKTILASGDWLVDVVHGQLEISIFTSNARFEEHIAKHDKWLKATNSDSAKIALANSLGRYAFKARGQGHAGTVTDEGWKKLEQRSNDAWSILKSTKERPADWYTAALCIGLTQFDRDEYDKLVAESQKKYPDHDLIICLKAHRLQPRWDGSPGEAEEYIETEAAKRSQRDGDILYARVGAKLDGIIHNVIAQTDMKWPRIKKGLETFKTRTSPSSETMLGKLSIIAMKADDKQAAEQAFDK